MAALNAPVAAELGDAPTSADPATTEQTTATMAPRLTRRCRVRMLTLSTVLRAQRGRTALLSIRFRYRPSQPWTRPPQLHPAGPYTAGQPGDAPTASWQRPGEMVSAPRARHTRTGHRPTGISGAPEAPVAPAAPVRASTIDPPSTRHRPRRCHAGASPGGPTRTTSLSL